MIPLQYRLALALVLALQLPLKAQQVAFEKGSWKAMLDRAKAENKLIFVDVYATWCGPCKMLDQQVFTDKQVAATYNALFINYKADAEHGEGLMLARKYNVRAYPTALFIDGDGQLIDDRVGYLPAPVFKQEGERVFRKTPLGLMLSLHEADYKEGDRTSAFMRTYLRLRQQAGLSSAEMLNDYVSHLPADSLKTPINTALLLENTKTCTGAAFETLMSRKDERRFRSAIQILVQEELSAAGKQRDLSRFTTLCSLVERLEPADQVPEIVAQYQLVYHAEAEDWASYARQGDSYATQYLMPRLTAETKQRQPQAFQQRYDQLCNIGYFVSQHSKDNTRLASLLTNLALIGQLSPTPLNTSLQACLRYRLGEREEAVALQTKAIDLARTNGDDVASYEDTLRRMQKRKSL